MASEPVIVWLLQEAGEIFLGLSVRASGSPITSRYSVIGTMDGSDMVGVWVDVEFVQERSLPDSRITKQWTIDPKRCFIKWGFVAYLQKGKSSETSMGFVPIDAA